MENVVFNDIHSVAELIKKGELSPVSLTKQLLERIHALNPHLNAYIAVLDEEAIAQAEQLEKELLEGNIRGPLHGIPIALKDIFETKGSITTSGSKVFEHAISDQDAEIVKKLKEAGAIIIGKANLHEFAMGATTENPHYGPSRNPWNTNKIPGGSSGGSAVAVAAGLAFGAVGTDTGGSIRLPAALCGIVGLKPTYDVISRHGCTPLSWTLDHIGPMTRTVADSRMMLEIMADEKELAKLDLKSTLKTLDGVKIGVPEAYFFDNMASDVKAIIQQAMARLKELGATLVDMKLENVEEALEAQKTIAKSEAYTVHEEHFTNTPELYGKDSHYRLNAGREILASQYIKAMQTRQAFITHTLSVMQKQNIQTIFTPTNTIAPFEIGSVSPEESINNIFKLGRTSIGNLLGFPSISVPCGFNEEGLPVGFQLISKPYGDGMMLNIAEVYEKAESWMSYLEKNEVYLAGEAIGVEA